MRSLMKHVLLLGNQGAAAPTPWYRVADAPQPIAAYSAKDADSYEASLVNLANPGTYDLTKVGSGTVSFGTATGWGFAGDAALEMGSFTPPDAFTIFIRFKNSAGNITRYYFGGEASSYKFGIQRYTASVDNRMNIRRGNATTVAAAWAANGTHAFTNTSFYHNAALIVGEYTVTSTEIAFRIGGAGGTTSYFVGNIEYFAIYDSELTPAQIQALHEATSDTYTRLVLTFDDASASQYSEAFAYMQPRGINGTLYVITSKVGTANFMTWEQLQEMDAAGWSIGNHTHNHPNLAASSLETIETELTTAQGELESHALATAAKHVCYPGGGTFTADMATAMVNTGMLTGRTTITGNVTLATTPFYKLPLTSYPQATTSLATVQASINASRRLDAHCIIVFHQIVETPTTYDWSIGNFEDLIDWIVAQGLNCITIEQLYTDMQSARA